MSNTVHWYVPRALPTDPFQEGYVVAISPFNFTAIGANLPTSAAIMGNAHVI